MKNRTILQIGLAGILGVAGAVENLGGCAAQKPAIQSGIYWTDSTPFNYQCTPDTNGNEKLSRSRIFFEDIGVDGTKSFLRFDERKTQEGNRWQLNGVWGVQDRHLFDVLSQRLPGLSRTLSEGKIKIENIQIEDVYQDGRLIKTRIYLPNGQHEEYIPFDKSRPSYITSEDVKISF